MRVAFYVLACACLASNAWADLIVGEQGENDILLTHRVIFKPPIPWRPMLVHLSATAPPSSIITYINVTDQGRGSSDAVILKGGLGQPSVHLIVVGKPGEGLLIEFTVYGSAPLTTTTEPDETTSTEAPTSTSTKAPASTTTEGPTTTSTKAPASTTTEAPASTTTEGQTSTSTKAPTSTTTEAPISSSTTLPTTTSSAAPTSTSTGKPISETTAAPDEPASPEQPEEPASPEQPAEPASPDEPNSGDDKVEEPIVVVAIE